MVTNVEGVTGATVNGTEEIGSSRGVFIKTNVLATREVGLVIMGSGSTISVGESGLVITFKAVAAGIGDVVGVKIDSLVNSSWSPVCSEVGMVEGTQTLPRRLSSNHQWKRVDIE